MTRFGAAALAALVCALPSFASAQDVPPSDPPVDEAREDDRERDDEEARRRREQAEERREEARERREEAREEREEAREEREERQGEDDDPPLVRERDYADERPEPPAGPEFGEAPDFDEGVEVARDAGVGSPLAYGRQSVLEFGGMLSLSHRSETTELGASPSLGYFLFDGFQLTLFTLFRVIHVSGDDQAPEGSPEADGQTDWVIQPLVEPSYHLALNDMLYVFAGAGLGLSFAEDPTVDFVVRPRIGLDVLIGRSAIFKPAFFMDLGVADGLGAIGVEGGFTAMW
jgi:hypothetical protein